MILGQTVLQKKMSLLFRSVAGLNRDQFWRMHLKGAVGWFPIWKIVGQLESLASQGHNWQSGLGSSTTWELGWISLSCTQLRMSHTPGGQSGSGVFLIPVGKWGLTRISEFGLKR